MKYRILLDFVIESDDSPDIILAEYETQLGQDQTIVQTICTNVEEFEDFEEKELPIKVIDEDTIIGHA